MLSLFFGLSPSVQSAVSENTISRKNGLKMRLVPSNPDPVSGLGTKTIEVRRMGSGVQVRWFSPSRIKTKDKPWPEYKIKVKRGAVQTTAMEEAQSLSHPHLWIQGFVNLDRNGLLWVPPQIIDGSSKKKSHVLEVGFLSPSFSYFQKGPKTLVAKIADFRRQVLAVPGDEVKTIKKKKLSSVDKFIQEFSTVRIISSSKKQPLVINGERIQVPAVILGNKYVEYTVLKSVKNPLILSVKFKTAKAPAKIKSFLKFFHKNMEYRITQINTGG